MVSFCSVQLVRLGRVSLMSPSKDSSAVSSHPRTSYGRRGLLDIIDDLARLRVLNW